MNQDEFTKQIIQKLDHLAKTHAQKNAVQNNVLQAIKPNWKYALAAALAIFMIVPTATHFFDHKEQTSIAVSNKISPQMAEDLEMMMVFGEDKTTHGS